MPSSPSPQRKPRKTTKKSASVVDPKTAPDREKWHTAKITLWVPWFGKPSKAQRELQGLLKTFAVMVGIEKFKIELLHRAGEKVPKDKCLCGIKGPHTDRQHSKAEEEKFDAATPD